MVRSTLQRSSRFLRKLPFQKQLAWYQAPWALSDYCASAASVAAHIHKLSKTWHWQLVPNKWHSRLSTGQPLQALFRRSPLIYCSNENIANTICSNTKTCAAASCNSGRLTNFEIAHSCTILVHRALRHRLPWCCIAGHPWRWILVLGVIGDRSKQLFWCHLCYLGGQTTWRHQ